MIRKVTHRSSKYVQEVTKEQANLLKFRTCITLWHNIFFFRIIPTHIEVFKPTIDVNIAETQNTYLKSKTKHQNYEKENEIGEVLGDDLKHCDDRWKAVEDSQEKESLVDSDDDDDEHSDFADDVKGSKQSVKNDLGDSNYNIHNINHIPPITQVLYSFSPHLSNIIDRWIHNSDH